MTPGTLVWITGLPGAGKTTLSLLVWERLRQSGRAVVRLDGDLFREVMGNDLGYSMGDRLANAKRLGRMCKLLTDQGVDVVCATVSLFQECHRWNREQFARYLEIFVRVGTETLRQRDQKGLYSRGVDAVGVDQPFDIPAEPDLIVDNDGARDALAAAVQAIVERFPA